MTEEGVQAGQKWGDIDIMDNLPAYSPDFNPIEMAFSKLKALLRKAARANHPGATVSPRQSIRSHHRNVETIFAAAAYEHH